MKYLLPLVVLLVIGVGVGGFLLGRHAPGPEMQNRQSGDLSQDPLDQQDSVPSDEIKVPTANPSSNTPADLHALPLGDHKESTRAQKGYVYTCRTQSDMGGAFQIGPWINQSSKTWDKTQKLMVSGQKQWPNHQITVSIQGDKRLITSNGYPTHTTGIYPIQASDQAYKYDRNPNSIQQQQFSFSLPVNPQQQTNPGCIGGEVGIMLSGIPIFNAFDAGGRDAMAYEVQDSCAGHPQVSGLYHYHGPSSCFEDSSSSNQHSALVGYAFDGFGIYGLKGDNGTSLSTADLDECHGHNHSVSWEGTQKQIYHYHLTNDFPYSVGCFRGSKAVQGPLGGSPSGAGQQGGQRPSGPPPGPFGFPF